MIESKVLSQVFGSKWVQVTGEWRILHNGELWDVYSSINIIRVTNSIRIRWARYVAHMRKRRGAFRGLVGRPEGKRPLGRSRPRQNYVLKWLNMKWNGEV